MLIKFYKKIKSLIYYLFIFPIYKLRFKSIGKKTRILSPLAIDGSSNISLGQDVVIGYKSWIAAKSISNSQQAFLNIKSGCRIGNFNHIYSTGEIIIEKNVLTADKVYISDNLHNYEDINIPIMHQPIKQLKKISIGEGTWLGENVCIIGCSIGKGCVVGSNSVVTKDIPDFCIVVGIPGKIIKRFDSIKNEWRKTNENGIYL